jgi:hypothetical protein
MVVLMISAATPAALPDRPSRASPSNVPPSAKIERCDLIEFASKNVMIIPIGTRGVIQHQLLGELAVDLKQERKHPIYPKGAQEAELLDGEIRGKIQSDDGVVTVALCPHLVTDLATWIDRCATRILDTLARLDAVKAHVAARRPDWREPGEPLISNTEFVARLRLLDLSHYDDKMTATLNDGGLYGGHFFLVTIEEDGTLNDEVDLAG